MMLKDLYHFFCVYNTYILYQIFFFYSMTSKYLMIVWSRKPLEKEEVEKKKKERKEVMKKRHNGWRTTSRTRKRSTGKNKGRRSEQGKRRRE